MGAPAHQVRRLRRGPLRGAPARGPRRVGRVVQVRLPTENFKTDPGALKVPFFHNNDDYDEVLFYHAGDFFSRDNIDAGMMTFHPAGFTHGPHPKALANMLEQKKPATDEYAVMIDTRDPLDVGEGASRVENLDYVNSWKPKAK